MRFIYGLLFTLVLAGCNSEPKVERYTDDKGVEHDRVYQPNGGMVEHLAGAAVAGAAAGAAGAASHRITDHAINRWHDRKAARQSRRSVHRGRR